MPNSTVDLYINWLNRFVKFSHLKFFQLWQVFTAGRRSTDQESKLPVRIFLCWSLKTNQCPTPYQLQTAINWTEFAYQPALLSPINVVPPIYGNNIISEDGYLNRYSLFILQKNVRSSINLPTISGSSKLLNL